MRRRRCREGVTVNAIAGTHVVTLGLDLDEERRKDCLGFAIQREDKTEEEKYWLRGMKTFPATDPGLGPGGTVSSREHPFQTFQWADYSAKPGHRYTYTVVPLYGSAKDPREGTRVSVPVETEVEIGAPHSVFFNRGSVASQEYARQFQNEPPDKLSGQQQAAAYRWLSRGLEEAMIAFIERAAGEGWGLHGAIFELRWPSVMRALGDAARRGAEVSVLYHAQDDIGKKNAEAIATARIKGLCRPRTSGDLMHNKFLVLTKGGNPLSVWTGSTNVTLNGLYSHLNCGHIVEDAGVAADYLAYWRELCSNPEDEAERTWMGENNPRPPLEGEAEQEITTVFSPHKDLAVLDWYRDIAASAKEALMMSFAFGMDERFKDVYRLDDDVLRWALMDKAAAGGRRERIEREEEAIHQIRTRPNVVIAIGNRIETNEFDRWLEELSRIGPTAVPWVHTKFMLVDPLGEEPVTITGSANWSDESTNQNTENMLVIRGDKRVADIYFGEFMRLHTHYAFRESLTWPRRDRPSDLDEDDGWQADYFDRDKERYWKRRYFARSD